MSDRTIRTQRPTRIEEKVYLRFVHRCRMEKHQIRETMEKLFALYAKKGDAVFSEES